MDTDRITAPASDSPSTNGTSASANAGPASLQGVAPATSGGHLLALGLSALLGFAGVAHFVRPQFFDPIVPDWMPGNPRTTTYASGVVELTAAALVAVPRTRRFGGWFAALTFIGVFPPTCSRRWTAAWMGWSRRSTRRPWRGPACRCNCR